MPTLESAKFEEDIRRFLSKKWGVILKSRKIKIKKMEHSFDLVSDNGENIGDAKFYHNRPVPAAQFSTIAEYVWLLEKIKAKHKFLIFGCDKKIPIRWLKRFGCLTKIKFYFFKKDKLEELN